MKNKLFHLALVITLLIGSLPSAALAAKAPVFITIDVRNTTGTPVEFNYRGPDGVLQWATIPTGVSSLTIAEGSYTYWADAKCGHIAGNVNLVKNNLTLWIGCSDEQPALFTTQLSGSSHVVCEDFGIYFIVGRTFYSKTFWWDLYFDDEVLSWAIYTGGVWACASDVTIDNYHYQLPP